MRLHKAAGKYDSSEHSPKSEKNHSCDSATVKDIAVRIGNHCGNGCTEVHRTPKISARSSEGVLSISGSTKKTIPVTGSEFPRAQRAVENPALDSIVANCREINIGPAKEYASKVSRQRRIAQKMNVRGVCACGIQVKDAGGGVTLSVYPDGSVGYSGFVQCGRTNVCPNCGYKVAQHFKGLLSDSMQNATAAGWQFVLITFTGSHTRLDRLSERYDCVNNAMRATFRSTYIRRLFGLQELPEYAKPGYQTSITEKRGRKAAIPPFVVESNGYFMKTESVFSETKGWHSHRHVLLMCKGIKDVQTFADCIYTQYEKEARKIDNKLPTKDGKKATFKVDRQGFDVRIVDNIALAAQYVSKWETSSELTASQYKKSQSKTYTQLLEAAEKTGQSGRNSTGVFKNAVYEYAEAMHGKRLFVFPPAWKQFLSEHQAKRVDMAADDVVNEKKEKVDLFRPSFASTLELRKNNLVDILPVIAAPCMKKGITEKALNEARDKIIIFLSEKGLEVSYCPDSLALHIEQAEQKEIRSAALAAPGKVVLIPAPGREFCLEDWG